MYDNHSIFKNNNNSLSSFNNCFNSRYNIYSNSSNNKNKNKKTRYFDVYRQIKEEMNNSNSKNKTKKRNKKKKKLIDEIYLKNTEMIDNYIESNYPNLEVQGTTNLEGIEKKDLAKKIKNNQSYWIEQIPGLRYRNPELNKNRKRPNLTPIPFNSDMNEMNNYQKKELDRIIREAINARKTEYTHASPPLNSQENIYQKNQKKIMINQWLIINEKIKII